MSMQMIDRFRLTLAQLNPTVGDLESNARLAKHAWRSGKDAGSNLVALPEMFITGYNTQDLVMKPAFHKSAIAMIEKLAVECADGPALAIGAPTINDGNFHNSYCILKGGRVTARVFKHHLPNEMVFDEVRLYDTAPIGGPYSIDNVRIGSPICEDAWYEDVPETLAETGAEFLIVPNGSPYFRNKMDIRINKMVSRVVETGLSLIYLNLVGGQDDQVFDGGSFAINPGGVLAVQMPLMEEAIEHVDLSRTDGGWRIEPGILTSIPDDLEQDYKAMVLALRDYTCKTGYQKVLLGLSGGIDSATVAAIAVDALGPKNVRCIMLPSKYTSRSSLEDARQTAENLGCRHEVLPISPGHRAITKMLSALIGDTPSGTTDENVQSRLRGLLLMALSNHHDEMLLATGNKSEVAVGYSTIYGDMAGGYNPIKDLYKTRVFEICRWRNSTYRDWMKGMQGEVIPDNVIVKPPTAELRENQKDSDSLPDYPVLDGILEILVDNDGAISDCIEAGYARADAERIEHLVYTAEYKRFQSAPGTRLSEKAFWLDRRYPIANRWRESEKK